MGRGHGRTAQNGGLGQILSGGLTAAVLVIAVLLGWTAWSPDSVDAPLETAGLEPPLDAETGPETPPEIKRGSTPPMQQAAAPVTGEDPQGDAVAPARFNPTSGQTDQAQAPAATPPTQDVASEDVTSQEGVQPEDQSTQTIVETSGTPNETPDVTVETQAEEAPAFDVIRVDGAGGAVVAGSAQPGGQVRVLVDGETVAETTADRRGNFVALFDLAPSQAARSLTLEAEWTAGTVIASRETALVSPFAGRASPLPPGLPQAGLGNDAVTPPTAETDGRVPDRVARDQTGSDADDTPSAQAPSDRITPDVVILSEAGVARPASPLAQPERPGVPRSRNVVIDTISYDARGEVILLGRAAPGREVRIYLNNALAHRASVAEAGVWQARVTGIKSGLYTLRADEVDAEGAVMSRFETPFERAVPEDALRAAAAAQTPKAEEAPDPSDLTARDLADGARSVAGIVTVQPGFTLWQIARENYGEGLQYVRVFDANRERILNPDLIYPGQVFTVPEQ